jgi:hypothetical protein
VRLLRALALPVLLALLGLGAGWSAGLATVDARIAESRRATAASEAQAVELELLDARAAEVWRERCGEVAGHADSLVALLRRAP